MINAKQKKQNNIKLLELEYLAERCFKPIFDSFNTSILGGKGKIEISSLLCTGMGKQEFLQCTECYISIIWNNRSFSNIAAWEEIRIGIKFDHSFTVQGYEETKLSLYDVDWEQKAEVLIHKCFDEGKTHCSV